jgi:hypothetical protein
MVNGEETEAPKRNPFVQKEESFDKRFPLLDKSIVLTLQQKELLYKELRSPAVGRNEFEFALLRIERGTEQPVKAVEKVIEAHRRQFYGSGKLSILASLVTKSSEEWQRIYTESEDAAKRSLMGANSVSKLDQLQAEASRAQAAADAAQRELDKAFSEFNAIPAKVAALQARLGAVQVERDQNNVENILAEYRRAFGHWYLTGQAVSHLDDGKIATRLVLAEEKLAVLNEVQPQLLAEIEQLKERSRNLADQLGVKHNI